MEMQEGWNPELEAIVRSAAVQAGFSAVGVASAEPDGANILDGKRFETWVAAGRAGDMEYLKRRDAAGTLLRSGLRVAIPWARSIVVCAVNYDSALPRSIDPALATAGWIGRYAWSGRRQGEGKSEKEEEREQEPRLAATDYHDELLSGLRSIETRLRERVECETRCYVDTGPIVERGFAARAGVGWVAKNTCVINQEMGSWLLLGVIVTSLRMASDVAQLAAADRCGSCTRCIDACPTDALVAPREMDASRCIAYLTIEKKGSIAEELRVGMGRQVFGCDICQDVCPWNTRSRNSKSGNSKRIEDRSGGVDGRDGNLKAAAHVGKAMQPRAQLVNPSLEWLAEMDAKEFKRWFKGSPLERTGRKRVHRNVAIAMGNSGESSFLPRLRAWAEGEDAVLAEAANWAIERIVQAGHGGLADGSLC